MKRQTILFVLALALTLGFLVQKKQVLSDYVPSAPERGFANESIATPIRTELKTTSASAHSATLAKLPDGDFLAFWFSGSREGARDVRIYISRRKGISWSAPEPLLSTGDVMAAEWRFVRKLGNPVAVVDRGGRIHLFFVSVSLGGWAASQLNQMTSTDGGITWSNPRLLITSPFMNLSTLARTPAVHRLDGGFDLPIYHEGARKFPEVLHFDSQGDRYFKSRIQTEGAFIQPAIVALGDKTAVALLRDASGERKLRSTLTRDGGQTWSTPTFTDQVNPDAAVALARFGDGTLIMAYNPRIDGRSELSIATSTDGNHWQKKRIIESETGGEFSYPTILLEGDNVHLVYTWQRKHIRHLVFSRAWLTTENAAQGVNQ